MNARRVLIAAALLWAGLAGAAHAHGTRVFLSTPVSPPEGFAWVAPVSFLLLAAANFWLLWRLGRTGWRRAALAAGAAVGLGGLALYWFGSWAGHATTAPPPGLGWGARVHWGFGWSEVGDEFVTWNVIGLVFLAVAASVPCLILGIRGWRGTGAILGANAALYALCLLPYLCTGALSHGWCGGYTHSACRSQLAALGMEILTHARAHGRLPDGAEVAAMLDKPGRWGSRKCGVCPVGGARESEPRMYAWNPCFSGLGLDKLKGLKKPEVLLSCPYHPPRKDWWPEHHALYTADLLSPQMDRGREYVSLDTCEIVSALSEEGGR